MDTIKYTSKYTSSYDVSSNGVSANEKKTEFWGQNPNILFDKAFEFFPIDSMDYNAKLNAISRTVIVLTLISFLFTNQIRILVIGTITLVAIYFLHQYKERESKKKDKKRSTKEIETFDNPGLAVISGKEDKITNIFDAPDSSNPFSNVLMTDYDYNPKKKPAPPSYNETVGEDILEQAKNVVRELNPDQPDISDKLFKDLGDEFIFEQSLQPFYSNPATTIPNDQTGFAEFCYGSMISCKEGNLFTCARNLDRYTN